MVEVDLVNQSVVTLMEDSVEDFRVDVVVVVDYVVDWVGEVDSRYFSHYLCHNLKMMDSAGVMMQEIYF